MKTRTFGSLEAVVTGGTDREGGGDGPVVVLLHGFGAPGTDLVPLWRVLDVPREVRFVFPAAPIPLAMGMGFESRAWWMIDMAAYDRAVRTGEYRDLSRTIPDGLADARQKVNALLDAVEGFARAIGVRRLTLWVTEGNPRAFRVYERHGYTPTGVTEPFPRGGIETQLGKALT